MVRDGWADGWTDGKSDRWVSHLKKIRDTRGFSLMPLGKKKAKLKRKGQGQPSQNKFGKDD